MRPIRPVLLFFAALTLPRLAPGAQAPLLEPGARVRLNAPGLGGRLTGTLVAWESDTLVVRVDGEGLGLIVPRDSITQIEVGGKRPMTLEGVGLGLLGGTLLALIASPDWVDENGDCTLPCLAYEVSPDAGTRVVVLSLLGALLGGLAGAATKVDTWTPVRLERLDVGPAPGGGLALGVGVRVSF
jgi:hypothetical protein